MDQKHKSTKNSKRQFIPHEIALQRVKKSFERSKKNLKSTSDIYVEVK